MQSVMQMNLAQTVGAGKAANPAAKTKEPVEKEFFCLLNTVSDTAATEGGENPGETAAEADPQAMEINMALMAIMRIVQEQTQCINGDGVAVEETASGGTDVSASSVVPQGNTPILEAFSFLSAQGELRQSVPEDAVQALNAMLAQAAEQAADGSDPDAAPIPEQTAVSADTREGKPVEKRIATLLSKLSDADLDAALEKLGLEPDQIQMIKSYLSKDASGITTGGQDVGAGLPETASARAVAASAHGMETSAAHMTAGRQDTLSESVRPAAQHTAGQAAPAAFAAAGAEETADARTVGGTAATDIFTQLVEKAAAGIQEGKYRMSIQLRPEHLGKVSINMVMDADGLVVKIHAHNDNVESTISNQLAQLEQALKDKGVTVVRMEVAQENMQDGSRQSGNPRDAKKQRQGGYYEQGDGDLIDAAGEVFMTLQPYLYSNSVEFQA